MKPLSSHLCPAKFLFAVFAVLLCPSATAQEKRQSISKEQRAKDLLANSTILVDHKHWTLVPKAAVIHVPESLGAKVAAQPKGTFLSFKDFLTLNSTWIYAMPIRLEYARGQERIEESHFNYLRGMNKVVVTTYKRGPITLHRNAYPLPSDTAQPPNQ